METIILIHDIEVEKTNMRRREGSCRGGLAVTAVLCEMKMVGLP
jgi:hypothetical protein